MKEIYQRYKKRKEATKRLQLWHEGGRRGVNKHDYNTQGSPVHTDLASAVEAAVARKLAKFLE